MSKRDDAVALAEKGFRVFPIQPNSKIAAINDWPNKATADHDKVRAWWSEAMTNEPTDYNIGVSCDNLFVIDIDNRGGVLPLDALKAVEKLTPAPHVVKTPSGGYHVYLRLPEGARVANSVKKLGPTVDTRSFHGYVLGVGSEINGAKYEWIQSVPDHYSIPSRVDDLLIAPQSMIDTCGKPSEKAALDASVTYDLPISRAAATNYLKAAPIAVSGASGNSTTYAVAARVRDFAISPDTALDLMLDNWNARNEPPWDPLELEPIIQNAYRYAKNAPRAPGSEFEAVSVTISTKQELCFNRLDNFEPSCLPPRLWIVEGLLARGNVTILVSAPGAGKTQYLAQLALAVTQNEDRIANRKIAESVLSGSTTPKTI